MRTSPAAQEAGFRIGRSSSSLTEQTVYTDNLPYTANGQFSAVVESLAPSTTYYYQAFMTVSDGNGGHVEIVSEIKSFTTSAQGEWVHGAWLELPSLKGNEDFVGTFYGSGGTTEAYRNYSYNYSYTYYASLWTAYQLTKALKTGSASTSSWKFNPNIDQNKQVSITKNSYGTMYGDDTYSRGHQCPNAARKSDSQMNRQTYYATNQTPQIYQNFNQGIWSSLEEAERNLVTTDSDVVYVITGPAYRKVGGSETINYLNGATGQNANPTRLPIPNYYWKAFLKVKWSGGQVVSASAIGFWFTHKTYTNDSYTNYTVTVDQIETWTGFDLFANLPDDVEATAEANANWSSFQSF